MLNEKVVRLLVVLLFWISGDTSAQDSACDTPRALSTCIQPSSAWLTTEPANGYSHYAAESIRYFLSMKSDQRFNTPIARHSSLRVGDFLRPLKWGEWNPVNKWFSISTIHPHYAPRVIRYEFPPWLLTTGYGEITMKNVDEALRLFPTDYERIDCRAFPVQPFGRCHVVFLYGWDNPVTAEDDRTRCPIYEEFTFNEAGEITFIEAWSDADGYLPMDGSDVWAEGPGVKRLSTAVPGLGTPTGKIEPDSEAMWQAAAEWDHAFSAPYWDPAQYKAGPFRGMVEDINAVYHGTRLPLANISSFWFGWAERALRHLSKGVHCPL